MRCALGGEEINSRRMQFVRSSVVADGEKAGATRRRGLIGLARHDARLCSNRGDVNFNCSGAARIKQQGRKEQQRWRVERPMAGRESTSAILESNFAAIVGGRWEGRDLLYSASLSCGGRRWLRIEEETRGCVVLDEDRERLRRFDSSWANRSPCLRC